MTGLNGFDYRTANHFWNEKYNPVFWKTTDCANKKTPIYHFFEVNIDIISKNVRIFERRFLSIPSCSWLRDGGGTKITKTMEKEYLKTVLAEVNDHIMHNCVNDDGKWFCSYKKGMIVADCI